MTDDERIEIWKAQGDTQALRGLLEQYEPGIFAFMMRMLSQRQDAEDATQMAFTKAVRGLQSYRAQGSFKSWMYQIACNEARVILRQRKRRPNTSLSKSTREDATDWDIPDPSNPDPMESLLQGERLASLQAAVARLPEREREVVSLRLQLDCTFAEIATLTDTPLGTVLGRMRNATRRLRQALENPHE